MTLTALNLYFFGVYISLALLQRSGVPALAGLMALTGVAVIWIMPSFNLALLAARHFKKQLAPPEILAVAILNGIIILPGLLGMEFFFFSQPLPWLPVANALVIAAVVWLSPPLSIFEPRPQWSLMARRALRSPLSWAVVLHLLVTAALSQAFLALPDIDPYKWANWYTLWLASPGTLPSRPLFYFFVYLFTPGSGIALYTWFKYIFPLLGVIMILTGWLTMPRSAGRLTQLVWLLLPLFSPSLILYAALPIPQSLLIISTALFFQLILYSAITKHYGWYWLAGLTMAGAFFYHQAAALMFIMWGLVTLGWKCQELLSWARHYKTIALIAVLAAAYVGYTSGFYNFVVHWSAKIVSQERLLPNWRFPAYYISIDGQSVGWAGITGVLKYYLFYVGPLLLFIFLASAGLLLRSAKFRRSFIAVIASPSPWWVLVVCAGFFITLSEILPRLASLALLPERAWLFGGIFSGLLLWQLLLTPRKRPAVELVILGLIGISVGGALYVNNLKAYTIPDYQAHAAEWIKRNLPDNRIMISNEQPYLLTTNAESMIMPVDGISLCNLDLAREEFLTNSWERIHPQQNNDRQQITEVYLGRLRALIAMDRDITLADLERTSEHFIRELNENAQTAENAEELKRRAFIYHALPHPQNVLLDRPYVQANEEAVCLDPIFDEHPEMFMKIYDDQGLVRIWRYTTSN